MPLATARMSTVFLTLQPKSVGYLKVCGKLTFIKMLYTGANQLQPVVCGYWELCIYIIRSWHPHAQSAVVDKHVKREFQNIRHHVIKAIWTFGWNVVQLPVGISALGCPLLRRRTWKDILTYVQVRHR